MKRFSLLLTAVALCIASNAAPAIAFTAVDIKEAAFSYRPQAELLANPQYSGDVGRKSPVSKVQKDFTNWQPYGGVSPGLFGVRVRVRNYGNEASSPQPIFIKMFSKKGDFFVDQGTFFVDFEHLFQSARWEPMQTLTGTIPVLAPNETFDFYSDDIQFKTYLKSLRHAFPVELRAEIRLGDKDFKKI